MLSQACRSSNDVRDRLKAWDNLQRLVGCKTKKLHSSVAKTRVVIYFLAKGYGSNLVKLRTRYTDNNDRLGRLCRKILPMSFALKRIPNEIRIVNYLLRKNYDLRIGRVILQLFCVAPD